MPAAIEITSSEDCCLVQVIAVRLLTFVQGYRAISCLLQFRA